MRALVSIGLVLGLALSVPSALQAQANEQAVTAAKQVAQEWLALFDAGRYDSTWAEASAYFQSKIGKEQWTMRIEQTRKRRPVLDSLRSRSVVAARYTTSLPKAPEGEYVVVQYRATYADEQWVETVTLKKDPDGWRVAGYFTRPKP
jgi:hypothetical protein